MNAEMLDPSLQQSCMREICGDQSKHRYAQWDIAGQGGQFFDLE